MAKECIVLDRERARGSPVRASLWMRVLGGPFFLWPELRRHFFSFLTILFGRLLRTPCESHALRARAMPGI